MKIFQGERCLGCIFEARFSGHPRGRVLVRREHEDISEEIRQEFFKRRKFVDISDLINDGGQGMGVPQQKTLWQ